VVDDVLGDGEVDVGLEEGEADLAEGVVDVLVGEGALAAEGLEGSLEFFGEILKHGCFEFISGWLERGQRGGAVGAAIRHGFCSGRG
jgi:hypothetical protein